MMVLQVARDSQGYQENKDHQVSMEQQGHKVHLDSREYQEMTVSWGQEVEGGGGTGHDFIQAKTCLQEQGMNRIEFIFFNGHHQLLI